MNPKTNLFLTADLNISDVVLEFPYVMLLLEHFNIYVPLQEKTIHGICGENDLNPEVLLTFANLYNNRSYNLPVQFSFIEIPTILRFLKNSHVYYTEEMYPNIRSIIAQMKELNNHKEMELVEKFIDDYINEVTEHLDYEDKIAFPYMKTLHTHAIKQIPFIDAVSYSVHEYKDHHNDIEEKLNDLKNLLVKYLPRKNDHKLRRKLFFSLTELEFDLSIHAKIEDLILIPLVEKMEKYLKNPR
jgi:regulator of cell morphogenesis and NO signaling